MIKDTLSRLEAAVKALDKAGPKEKAELAKLVSALKSDLAALEGKHDRLRLSLEGFESQHPQLTEAVNEVCGFLAKLGI